MYSLKSIVVSLALFLFGIRTVRSAITVSPYVGLTVSEFILAHNYTCETHTITTEDGYILTTFRIPYGRNETTYTTRPAVLFLHGIFSNPNDFLVQEPDKSIGFLLADQGYDVWLSASRGNTYSINHTTLDTSSLAFWNFSWHEVGYYDMPANIEYITNLTGNTNVSFVGHSQGGTAYAAMAAARPEYNSRITVSLLFAPIIYLQNVKIPFFDAIKASYDVLKETGTNLKLTDILPYNSIFQLLGTLLCNGDSVLCATLIGSVAGLDITQMNNTVLQAVVANDPAGGAFHQLLHYLQIANSGEFRQYDWESDGNQVAYNQSTPPNYNLTLATAPVVVFYALNDYFAGIDDSLRFIAALPNAIAYQVSYSLMNHVDFVFAKDVVEFVNNPAIQYLNAFNNITTSASSSTTDDSSNSTTILQQVEEFLSGLL